MTRRLVFSHNFSMTKARAGWRLGTYPGSQLFGTTGLADLPIVDVATGSGGGRGRVQRWLEPRFGVLDQQWRMIVDRVRRGRGAIWYSGEYRTINLLLLLHRLHLARTPIVVVAHDTPAGHIDRACLPGADVILCISRQVARQLVDEFGIDADRVRFVALGPDLTFPGYRSAGSDYLLSLGKTERDLPTLLAALERTQLPARVYADAGLAAGWASRLPHVEFREPAPPRTRPGAGTYEHVLDDLQHAAVIAIPLLRPHRPFGLSELNDALALGKPVIMTTNPYIDCRPEVIGSGVDVEDGDVEGWVRAMERLMADPELRDRMGQRGREFAERYWNVERFETALREAVAALSAV